MEESHFQSFKKKVETKVRSEDDLEKFFSLWLFYNELTSQIFIENFCDYI